MVKQIGRLDADFRIVEIAAHAQWIRFYPLALAPISSARGNLADIYLRIEISCERQSVVSGIAVEYIDIIYFVKQVLLRVRAVHISDPGVETRAKHGNQAGLFKLVAVCPLPFILKFRSVRWFVVGGVYIRNPRHEARIHQRQILVRQCDVYQQIRPYFLYEGCNLRRIVGVNLCRMDGRGYFGRNGVAL